jgi:hypothetical protein
MLQNLPRIFHEYFSKAVVLQSIPQKIASHIHVITDRIMNGL